MKRWIPATLASLILACTSGEPGAEAITGPLDVGVAGPPQSVPTASYFRVRPDTRRCIYPLCGGFWIATVNKARTLCPEGGRKSECYVAEIDWAVVPSGGSVGDLISTGHEPVLRGSLTLRDYPGFGNLGVLPALEAWRSATVLEAPQRVLRVRERGTCKGPTMLDLCAQVLNSVREFALSTLDLSQVGATELQLIAADAAVRDGRLLAAGAVEVNGRQGSTLVASQFYLPYPF